jgi:hypothetical protein
VPPGAHLGDMTLGVGKIRGVEAADAISEFELQILDDHEGIIDLRPMPLSAPKRAMAIRRSRESQSRQPGRLHRR